MKTTWRKTPEPWPSTTSRRSAETNTIGKVPRRDGVPALAFAKILCGVRTLVLLRARGWTPHIFRGHITHQMWWTTFDAGDPHVRFDERDVETEPRRGYSGTARRKRRQQTNRTYCHRATSRLYRTAKSTNVRFSSVREAAMGRLEPFG